MNMKKIKLLLLTAFLGSIILGSAFIFYGCGAMPPTITSLTVNPTQVIISETVTIECKASDPNGKALSFTWSANAGTINGSGPNVTWTAPSTVGSYVVQVSVSDGPIRFLFRDDPGHCRVRTDHIEHARLASQCKYWRDHHHHLRGDRL